MVVAAAAYFEEIGSGSISISIQAIKYNPRCAKEDFIVNLFTIYVMV